MASQFYNAGYPGDSTEKILQRLEKECLVRKPTLTILQCGTNDAINPRARVLPEDFRCNLLTLTRKILAGGSCILIAPPPCIEKEVRQRYDFPLSPGEEGEDLNDLLLSYGRIMGEVAREQKIPFMDLYRIFTARGKVGDSPESLIRNYANSKTLDGAHPTIAGHRLISKMLHALLLAEGMDTSTTVFLGDSITSGYPFAGMGSMEGENFPSFTAALLNGE